MMKLAVALFALVVLGGWIVLTNPNVRGRLPVKKGDIDGSVDPLG